MRLLKVGDHAINPERINRMMWINGAPIGEYTEDPKEKNCLEVWFSAGDCLILDPEESEALWVMLEIWPTPDRRGAAP